LDYFDPGPPAGYRTVVTQPIPLQVATGAAGEAIETQPAPVVAHDKPAERDLFDLKPVGTVAVRSAPRGAVSGWMWLLVLLPPWLLLPVLRTWHARRERLRGDPEGARARAAAAVFRERAASPSADPETLLAEYLAARLHCRTAAVLAPELDARLVSAGVPAPLAQRAASCLHEIHAERFGGRAAPDPGTTTRELVDALESAFRSTDGER
jgi:hypothetical protein